MVRKATPQELAELQVNNKPKARKASKEELALLKGIPDEDSNVVVDVLKNNVLGGAGAGFDAAATLATGALASPISGLAGIGQGVISFFDEDEDATNEAANRTLQVLNALTRQPQTEVGAGILDVAGDATDFLITKPAQFVGDKVLDITDSPAAATAVNTGLEMLPGAVGIKPKAKAVKQNIKAVENSAESMGIKLSDSDVKKTENIKEAAEDLTGNREVKGESLNSVQESLQQAAKESRLNRDKLYNEARDTNASVQLSHLRGFRDTVTQSLKRFDVDNMPHLKKRLDELSVLDSAEEGKISLNNIAEYRDRINSNRPPKIDEKQNLALDILRKQLDNHVDNLFNSDMISGDPTAIKKWKDARQAHALYRENFKETKFIKDMIEKEATPEEMRSWLFGASSTGAKAQAGGVVKKIKSLIGDDSPEFNALRQDFLLNIVDPLLRETPDLKAFTKRYDAFVKNNNTLAKELFPDSINELKTLRDISSETNAITLAGKGEGLYRKIAVVIFGHSLAKSAMRVEFATKIMGLIRSVEGAGRRSRILNAALGLEAGAPLLQKRAAGIPAAIQSVQQEE